MKLRIDTFLIGSFLFWLATFALVLLIPKADLHLKCNALNAPWLDLFFKYITYAGDGVFAISIALVLMFWKLRYGIFIIVSYLSSGIFVQLGKRFLFADMKRPSAFFEGLADLHFVEGVVLHSKRTFPSGHTATAFGLFACLALLAKKSSYQFFFFMMAVVVAYSRVYLSQHFVVDILVGSIIGTLFSYIWYKPFENSRWVWMDKTVFGERA